MMHQRINVCLVIALLISSSAMSEASTQAVRTQNDDATTCDSTLSNSRWRAKWGERNSGNSEPELNSISPPCAPNSSSAVIQTDQPLPPPNQMIYPALIAYRGHDNRCGTKAHPCARVRELRIQFQAPELQYWNHFFYGVFDPTPGSFGRIGIEVGTSSVQVEFIRGGGFECDGRVLFPARPRAIRDYDTGTQLRS